MQCSQRLQQLLLQGRPAGEVLEVVDEYHVDMPKPVAGHGDPVLSRVGILRRHDEFIGMILTGEIEALRGRESARAFRMSDPCSDVQSD